MTVREILEKEIGPITSRQLLDSLELELLRHIEGSTRLLVSIVVDGLKNAWAQHERATSPSEQRVKEESSHFETYAEHQARTKP